MKFHFALTGSCKDDYLCEADSISPQVFPGHYDCNWFFVLHNFHREIIQVSDWLPVVTPKIRGFFGFLYGGRVSPNPKLRVFFSQNYVTFLGDLLAQLTWFLAHFTGLDLVMTKITLDCSFDLWMVYNGWIVCNNGEGINEN